MCAIEVDAVRPEQSIAPHGDSGDQILVQLPGFDDVARAKEIIRSTAKLELKLVDNVAPTEEQLMAGRTQLPPQSEIIAGVAETGGANRVYYLVERIPVITGRDF